MDVYRLTEQVHKSFDSLLENLRENYLLTSEGFHYKVIDVRNDISEMIWKAEKEYVALRKYNLLIDFLSKENDRIILNNIDTPYWMKGEIQYERPPGITKAEYDNLIKSVNEKFAEVRNAIPWHKLPSELRLSINFDGLQMHVGRFLADAFCMLNRNVKFTKGLYDRSMANNPFFKQNTPCEICGENRVINACHIIPNHLGGNTGPGNVLWLCPTHHRLFDRFLLSRDEYGKIEWQSKSKAAANFSYLVFRPIFENTWEKMVNEIFEKNGDPVTLIWGPSLEAIEAMILDMVSESEEIDVQSIS